MREPPPEPAAGAQQPELARDHPTPHYGSRAFLDTFHLPGYCNTPLDLLSDE